MISLLNSFVEDNGIPEPNSGCILWVGQVDQKGYGILKSRGRQLRANRVVLGLKLGAEIPEGICACHHCDTPGCINPDHIFPGTNADNVRDSVLKGRRHSKLSEDQVRAIKADDRTHSEIAKEKGISRSEVGNIKQGSRWCHVESLLVKVDRKRTSRNLGSLHPRTTFCDDDIRAIRNDPRTQDEIASDYGVGRRCIGRIKSGQRWSHVA